MSNNKGAIRIDDKTIIEEKCFELLEYFKSVCEENNIWYSLAYGTMLGAVRHKGYIPWDTDVDVFVFLPDKDLVRNAFMNNDTNKDIIFDNFDVQPHNTHSHDVLRFDGVDSNDIHLDIYYLVGAPKEYEQQKKFAKLTYVSEHIIRSKYNKLSDCHKKNRPLVFCAKIIDYCFPDKVLKKFINYLEHKYNFDEAEYVIALANWGNASACIPKTVFSEMIEQPFYKSSFAIPKDYDSFLRRTYGDDYMTPRRY